MIGSLFSGIGGIELGLESCGLGPVLWQCDNDPHARAVLATHWPSVRRYNDVKEIDEAAERPEIICGGFPCQDISLAGKGAGIDGARSGLWREFARIIGALKPSVVFIENVRALLSAAGPRTRCVCGWDSRWGGLLRDRVVPDWGTDPLLACALGEHEVAPCDQCSSPDIWWLGEPRDGAVGAGRDSSLGYRGNRPEVCGGGAVAVSNREESASEARRRDAVAPVAFISERQRNQVGRGDVPGVGEGQDGDRCVPSSGDGDGRIGGLCDACGRRLDGASNGIAGGAMATVLGDLARLGYASEWDVFRASDVGAPHRRERLFLLAYSDGERVRQLAERGSWGRTGERASEREHAEPVHDRAALADADGQARRREARLPVSFDGADAAGLRAQEPGRLGRRDVADAASDRRDEGRPESAGKQRRPDATERGGAVDVADTDGNGRESIGRSGLFNGERTASGHDSDRRHRAHRFPPGPAAISGWDGAQPAIRRGDDGVPGRSHRLRLLGNSVVPQQAALAWLTLSARVTTSGATSAREAG